MQYVLALFVGKTLQAAVFRIMAMLGLGVVTYGGGQYVISEVVDIWLNYSNQMPSQWLGLLGYMNLDRAFSLIVSAFLIKISVMAAKKAITVRSGTA